MKQDEFIELLIEEVEIEDTELTKDTRLNSIEEWDSLAVMTVISISDEYFQRKVSAAEINSLHSVGDLYNLVNRD